MFKLYFVLDWVEDDQKVRPYFTTTRPTPTDSRFIIDVTNMMNSLSTIFVNFAGAIEEQKFPKKLTPEEVGYLFAATLFRETIERRDK